MTSGPERRSGAGDEPGAGPDDDLPPEPDLTVFRFGRYVRRLRTGRRLTQDALAERSGLCADTIRRMEARGIGASFVTVLKLSRGLGLSMGTLLDGFERDDLDPLREVADTLADADPRTLRTVLLIARCLVAEQTEPEAEPEPEPDESEAEP